MATVRGRVDCYTSASKDGLDAPSRAISEVFANIVQQLSSSDAQGIGIQMLSQNYGDGRGPNGGFGFWDTANANAGNRAWATFRFLSASYGKFEVMVFCATGSTAGTNGGGMLVNGYSGSGGNSTSNLSGEIGIAIAVPPSWSSQTLWAGSISATSGTIGRPVWTLTSGSYGGIFPRANSQTNGGGTGGQSTTRNQMFALHSEVQPGTVNRTAVWRSHTILTEDSITIVIDAADDGSSRFFHFGPFLARSGSSHDAPYFAVLGAGGAGTENGVPPTVGGSVGTLSFASNTTVAFNTADGAICFPSLLSGAVNLGFYSLASIDGNNSYNAFINSGSYEKFPVWVGVRDSQVGIVGVSKYLSLGYGMNSNSVDTLSQSVAFGSTTAAALKFIIPWSGSYPRTGTSRTGRQMNFTI